MAARRRSQFHDGAQRPEVDIGKQPTMERQQLFTLKATTEPDDALATLKSSQHFGEHPTMEKRTIYSWFSTRTMEHCLLVGFHGNRLVLRYPWQPFASSLRQPSTVHISIVRRRIWGLTMSGKLTMLAEERQTNGCIKPCCEAIKRCPTAVVSSAEHWTHWCASDDGEL